MMNQALKTSVGAAALAFAIWLTPGSAQSPMYDRLHVELPYKITLGDKVLQPGDYTIQQLPSTGSSRILLFYTDNGMKFETSAMTIPALDPDTPRDTKVVLTHVGDDYYINKIWVQGKDYGYELPMPKSLKDRQKEATETTVAGRYEPTADTAAPTTASTATTTSADTTATTAAAPAETTPTAAATVTTPTTSTVSPTTSPATATDPNANANSANSFNPPAAQNPAPETAATGSANRSIESTATADQAPAPAPAPAEMPATAANWLMMLLGGGTLSGAGMMLRRRR